MEAQEQKVNQIKVLKVDSKDTWDSYVSQAQNQGCPIVAHFTAIWCIPSVAMNPFIEELASTYENVLFLSVDVDEIKEVASQYEVKAMPTFILIKRGAPVDKLVGANPDEIKKKDRSPHLAHLLSTHLLICVYFLLFFFFMICRIWFWILACNKTEKCAFNSFYSSTIFGVV